MKYFLLNLFLALAWMLINGAYSSVDFALGFTIGFFALWFSQPFGRKTGYFKRFRVLFALCMYFFYQMAVSVGRVVWDVLTPQHLSEPDIIQVPLDVETNLEITLLANMVSLTPGTLSLDVTPDRRYLVIHAMFAPNHQEVIDDIKLVLEKKILEVTRG